MEKVVHFSPISMKINPQKKPLFSESAEQAASSKFCQRKTWHDGCTASEGKSNSIGWQVLQLFGSFHNVHTLATANPSNRKLVLFDLYGGGTNPASP